MNKLLFGALLALTCAAAFALPAVAPNVTPRPFAPPRSVSALRFIGEKIVAFKQDYNGTTLGGFSGIDYRPDTDTYYLLCDDPSALQPVRYYTARLHFDRNSFRDVAFTGVTMLQRPDGRAFPKATSAYEAIDPEGIRYDAATNHVLWSSEGIRNLTLSPPALNPPFLREANLDGSYLNDYELPAQFQVKNTDSGTRSNGSFEGLSITPGGKFVFTAQEEPIFDDGPRAAFGVPATTRIVKFDKATRKAVGQYAYPLDAVHQAPVPATQFQLNGVVEVLALTETRLLVLERSYAVGATPDYRVRIYEVELPGATDVSSMPGLQGASYTPLSKRLVLDLATIGIPRVDNVEGLTFGPKLANGHYSLVLVSDDNFGPSQISQFLAFEVIP